MRAWEDEGKSEAWSKGAWAELQNLGSRSFREEERGVDRWRQRSVPWKETLDLNVGAGSEPQAAQFQQVDSCVQGGWPSIWGSFLTDASREASSLL